MGLLHVRRSIIQRAHLAQAQAQLPFSPLLRTFPTWVFERCIFMAAASNGRKRSKGSVFVSPRSTAIIVASLEDDRHLGSIQTSSSFVSVVTIAKDGASDRLCLSKLPKSANPIGFPLLSSKMYGWFGGSLLGQLVEGLCRYQASPLLEGFTPCRSFRFRLCSRIDR